MWESTLRVACSDPLWWRATCNSFVQCSIVSKCFPSIESFIHSSLVSASQSIRLAIGRFVKKSFFKKEWLHFVTDLRVHILPHILTDLRVHKSCSLKMFDVPLRPGFLLGKFDTYSESFYIFWSICEKIIFNKERRPGTPE